MGETTTELIGKVAIVTGASQGLGRAYALALAQAGATVVASSRSMGNAAPGEAPGEASLARTVQIGTEMGCPVHAAICDVGSEEQISRTVEETIGNFGRIDIVVNNAATYPLHFDPKYVDPLIWDADIWNRYFSINVLGPYFMMRAVAPTMKAQNSGSIVNVSSTSATLMDLTPDDLAHLRMMGYATTKSALIRLSNFFAVELSPWNVAVNSICPGTVITGAWGSVPDDQVEAARTSGAATDASPEAVGPYIVHLARQTAQGLTGKFLETVNYPNWS